MTFKELILEQTGYQCFTTFFEDFTIAEKFGLNADPFYGFNSLNNTLEFKVKTEEYDYTNLLKLLNFPEEFSFSADYGNEKGMYKLIGDSYVFHILDKYSNRWCNVVESYEKFKKKNWR